MHHLALPESQVLEAGGDSFHPAGYHRPVRLRGQAVVHGQRQILLLYDDPLDIGELLPEQPGGRTQVSSGLRTHHVLDARLVRSDDVAAMIGSVEDAR